MTDPKTSFRQTASSAGRELKAVLGLCRELKEFLRNPITLEQAEAEIKTRLECRGERFLDLVQSRVFARSESPYLKLFRHAGCDFAELRRRVARDGVEATLEWLARNGVYLTPDEFKGKRAVARGRESFRIEPRDLDNTKFSAALKMQTTGTNNRPRWYATSIEALAWRAASNCLFFAAHDLFSHAYAVYDAILPSNGGVRELLICARFGLRADRWFARKVPLNGRLAARWHETITRLIVFLGNRFGPGLPRPEFVDTQDVRPILDWVAEQRRRGKFCCMRATPSNAARIARSAEEKGISLSGMVFRVSGEPFTDAKREVIERAGARALPIYGFEGGAIGFACVNPAYTDDLHVDTSKVALIANPAPVAAAPNVHSLLVTTLDETGPRFYLNVDLGDYAILSDRRCGCRLEAAGLARHVHHIRSYEKFTTEGMNYFYGELLELLEKNLPAEFGGGPGDYQLVEEEDGAGQTRLTLVVHPDVENLNPEKLIARLRKSLAQGSRANAFQSAIWQDAGTLRIRRAVPQASARGKIQPLLAARP